MKNRSAERQQLALQFPRLDPDARPLIETGAYASAVSALRRWRTWPDGRLVLMGEPHSGRSRLLKQWAAETGAALVTGEDLARADMDDISGLAISGLAVDDADHARPADGLLAAINLCGRRGAPILLSGEGDPAHWHAHPPDLASRLQAMSVASIPLPDLPTLGLRLTEECHLRHLRLPPEVEAYLVARMPLRWSSIALLADELEQAPVRAFTLRNVRPALARLGVPVD